MSGASMSRPGPTMAAGGRVITWDPPAAANVARSIRPTTPIGRRHPHAQVRRSPHVSAGVETTGEERSFYEDRQELQRQEENDFRRVRRGARVGPRGYKPTRTHRT